MTKNFKSTLDDVVPVVAILRGVKSNEVLEIARALIEAGFEVIEVPLNSPQPLESIKLLAEQYGEQYLIGAGTVTTVAEVEAIYQTGGRLIVAPNTNQSVIKSAKALGMVCVPGCLTPSEAFSALEAGADALKFFPANAVAPGLFKALRSVLPKGVQMYAVGGVNEDNLQEYAAQGITGFGLGSSLYKVGKSIDDIADSARKTIEAFNALN